MKYYKKIKQRKKKEERYMRNIHTKQCTVEVGVEFRRREVEPVAVFRALGATSLATGIPLWPHFSFPAPLNHHLSFFMTHLEEIEGFMSQKDGSSRDPANAISPMTGISQFLSSHTYRSKLSCGSFSVSSWNNTMKLLIQYNEVANIF